MTRPTVHPIAHAGASPYAPLLATVAPRPIPAPPAIRVVERCPFQATS